MSPLEKLEKELVKRIKTIILVESDQLNFVQSACKSGDKERVLLITIGTTNTYGHNASGFSFFFSFFLSAVFTLAYCAPRKSRRPKRRNEERARPAGCGMSAAISAATRRRRSAASLCWWPQTGAAHFAWLCCRISNLLAQGRVTFVRSVTASSRHQTRPLFAVMLFHPFHHLWRPDRPPRRAWPGCRDSPPSPLHPLRSTIRICYRFVARRRPAAPSPPPLRPPARGPSEDTRGRPSASRLTAI